VKVCVGLIMWPCGRIRLPPPLEDTEPVPGGGRGGGEHQPAPPWVEPPEWPIQPETLGEPFTI